MPDHLASIWIANRLPALVVAVAMATMVHAVVVVVVVAGGGCLPMPFRLMADSFGPMPVMQLASSS